GPRTAVLPLDTMKTVYPLNLMKERGVLGVASRLIKYAPRYEKLINALLGRVIVVQDTATARRLIKRGLGLVVTTDGIVFHPAGHITGGQPQTERPFLLGYERDLETIPKEIERIERSMEITEREAITLREALRESEKALASLTREVEASLDKRTGLQDSLGQRQQRLAQLRGEMRALAGSQAGIRDRKRAATAEIDKMGQDREAMLAEATECFEM